MKLTINRKLLLGYLTMAFLAILASAYAIYSLQNLNEMAYTIITQNFDAVEKSKRLMDTLLARESAEKKYIILKDPSLAEAYWSRSQEFATLKETLNKSNFPGMQQVLRRIDTLHQQYDEIFRREMALLQENQPDEAKRVSDEESRRVMEEMATDLLTIQRRADKDIDTKMNLINERGLSAARITIVLAAVSLFAGLAVALLITYNISRPLKKLEKATAHIAEGRFDQELDINRHDEIGTLADAFRTMTERLKILEALNLDASPLTGLPGNLAIEKEIERRRMERNPFSLCHIDLDNFKPFADKYGYAWGSEVIKEVANLVANHLDVPGQEEAFVGHVGGDDYVIVARPEVAERMCRLLVEIFEDQIITFYSEEDRERRYIIGKDRKGVPQKYPLITITAAMVTEQGSTFDSPLAMARKAAELKEYAKTLPGSNYITQEDLQKRI